MEPEQTRTSTVLKTQSVLLSALKGNLLLYLAGITEGKGITN